MKETNSNIPKRASFKTVVSNGIWVYKALFKMSPQTIFLLTVSTLAIGILPTASAFYMAQIIDQLINVSNLNIVSISDLLFEKVLITPIIIYAFIRSVNYLNNTLNWYLESKIKKYYMIKFEVSLERKISDLDLQHFEDPKIMNGIRKATDNTYKMYNFFYDSIDLIRYIVSIGISSYIVFRLSTILGLFIMISSIPGILIMLDFINRTWNFINSTFEKRRKSWWLSNRLKRPENREESTITKSNIYVHSLVQKYWDSLGLGELKILKRRFLMDIVDNSIMLIQNIITPVYLFFQTIRGIITVGQFTFFFGKINDFNNDLFNIISRISNLWDSGSYIQFIRDVFEIKPAIESGKKSIKTDKPPEIQFKNVWFKYPNNKNYTLKDINLTIRSSDEIAIVGENGAGKTTLIKLLLRFYDPTKGEILIDGKPLKEVDLNFYHRAIGALFQEFEKFAELNVIQNIKIGNIASGSGLKEVKEAAKMADSDTFINKLEKKYEQILDKSFSEGTKLSTGQWQKIALARMFYRNAPVLILDEPTASIDANAEYRIFKRIFETFKGKTLIIISHRFSTVRNAQKIYVIHEGEIVEEGSHDELIKKNGRYKKAFDLQAKGYQE